MRVEVYSFLFDPLDEIPPLKTSIANQENANAVDLVNLGADF